jgi:hypothetical protein
MVQQLLNILIAAAQMVGLGMLAWGCFLIAGATFSGRHAGFIKGERWCCSAPISRVMARRFAREDALSWIAENTRRCMKHMSASRESKRLTAPEK